MNTFFAPPSPRRVAHDLGRQARPGAVNPYAVTEAVLREAWDEGRQRQASVTPRLERVCAEMTR